MPYINDDRRYVIDFPLQRVADSIDTPGDLNYVICRLWSTKAEHNYHDMSRWLAAVRDAADEISRRVVGPYEDQKCFENGDVFDEHTS